MKKKRKQRSSPALIWSVIILGILAAAAYYISDYIYNPSFAKYKEFGIRIPSNYYIHGIDVSRYQESISWEQVKNMQVDDVKLGFAFIKATEGVDKVDQQFRRNWHHAARNNMPRGAYHYFYAHKQSKQQANNFVQTVRLQKGDLPPVLDVEEAFGIPTDVLQQRVSEWLVLVERKYKVKPIIYSNIEFYNQYLKGKFEDYPLWVAHYVHQDEPRINRKWLFWQHSESGRVNGIDCKVDFNVFNGDSATFRQILIQ
jgi:lysozyme